jgi:predicted PurR-regulated permease PerM
MVWALSVAQQGFEERSRTISLAVVALGVLICGLRFFKDALIPLVLAIALKHLLQPVINVLTNRPLRCCGRSLLAEPMACVGVPRRNRRLQTLLAYACRLQLSRTAAAIVSLLLAFAVLGAILAIVADSVHVLVDNAEEYAKQLKVIVGNLLGWVANISCQWTRGGCPLPGNATNTTSPGAAGGGSSNSSSSDATRDMINQLFSLVPIESLVKYTAEFLLEMGGNLFFVILFTVYLLLDTRKGKRNAKPEKPSRTDLLILAYIKGKVMLSLVVGVVTAIILLAVGLELWLIFGALAFWLNFVPTVGAVVAVFLPMPLVILDPDMSLVSMILAFVLPFTAHMVVGNVLEPLLFGHSLELQPVAILLSLTIWSMLWGLTGMILAVPITAVLKIHLDSIDHPASKFLVRLLVGGDGAADEGAMALQPTEDTIHSGAAGSSTLPLVERSLANPEEP